MYQVHLSLKDLQKIHNAAQIINEKIEQHYTIPELAELVDLPEKKLKAGFKHLFNTGAFRYRCQLLWHKVKNLLLADKPLKTIAQETGFRDKSALIKAFKNEFGSTPIQWKKDQENKVTA
ncbi:helix-turn-helix transcriptional regulator [Niastella caeni]|uniref:Helix-turn-helix transcriptional regulator n=1 Tax=Niastella caeni TaxID=2569763 RepID=A0A4S8H7G6_9BACT|nr:AraC family transcriptional regulator [Niastella caeni]THU30790.1 helix-turn-helix transcriptional regulator [Niastella caeni]